MNTTDSTDDPRDPAHARPAATEPTGAPRRLSVRSRPSQPATPDRRAVSPASHWILMASFIVALAWSGGAAAYVLGFYGVSTVTGGGPERLLGFGFIVIGPALILVTLGVVTSEFFRLATFAHSIDVASRRLAAPVDHAQGDARRMADVVAHEVDRISRAAESALNQLGAMEDVLRHHADSVNQATAGAREEVNQLIVDLRDQRDSLGDVTRGLGVEAQKIADAIDRQAEMVAAAAELADAHADEGRQLLEEGSQRLQLSATQAQQSGEKAAFAISEQMSDMEALVESLDERATRLENLAKSQADNLRASQTAAHELGLAAESGADAMKVAVDTSLEQARRLTDMVEQEMRAISSKSAEDIERVRAAADAARIAADNASRTLEANAAAVLERMEQLNDASLNAAGHVDEALQTRLRGVERMISSLEERASQSGNGVDRGGDMGFHDAPPTDRDFNGLPARRAPRGRRFEDDVDFDPAPTARRSNGGDYFLDEDRHYDRGGREEFPRYDAPAYSGDGVNGGEPGYADRGFDDHYDRRNGADDEDPALSPNSLRPVSKQDESGWRWKDLLRNIDETPSARASSTAGDAVVSAMRRAGVDPARALDPDMTARIARARRRAGVGEARALVLDSAISDVRRTAAALAADPTLRGRAEGFLDEHARLVRRAIDQNDIASLSALLDTDPGRAYLLIDAALADV